MYSLDDLDQGKACETPYEFEVTDDNNGKGTGLFLSVVGGQSERVADLVKKTLDAWAIEDAMAEKRDPRGKQVHVRAVKEKIDYSTELVAIRIVGWRGIREPYTPEGAIKLCTTNSTVKEQILAVSENMQNFPTALRATSPGTSATAPI